MGTEAVAEAALHWISLNREWAAVATFVLAFAEFIPFVWVLLVAIGPLVGAGDPGSVWIAITSATAGAALSDWALYWLGHRYHERVQHMWPLRTHPNALNNGRAFFRRWGIWAIFIGRFAGPLRASVPIAAGVAEMPIVPFQIANWLSALCWGAILILPGAWGIQRLLDVV